MKTNPTGIRFEEEDLEFIKRREGLDTPQQVVYFLCSQYCEFFRVKKQNIFASTPTKESYDGSGNNTICSDEVDQYEKVEETIQVQDFNSLMKRILASETVEQISKISEEIETTLLTFFEKRDLRAAAKEHSRNFYND